MKPESIGIIVPSSFSQYEPGWFIPVPALANYVQCIWTLPVQQAGSAINAEKLYPDAGASLMFEFSGDTVICRFCFNTQTLRHQWSPEAEHLSIRIKPGAICALLDVQFLHFANASLPLDEPDLAGINRLSDELLPQNHWQRVETVQTWLINRLSQRQAGINAGLVTALSSINTAPEQYANKLGMSRRTLERRMRSQLGVSPNQMLDFRRIRLAREQLISGTESLADIALTTGFYDQAHFTNLFRDATMESPAQYRRRKLSQISNTRI
ncbi:AraC family transcriptional regulator [Aestuariibacter sp. GS-14]|uniref:helix-turn-helix domain-containing protein n=1 Tax=Aestuariibacter sp. GS-14 TaxID=2590670 RepID=UPI00112AA327|nr:helix-turn-helix domain-containing protein [Aestuariibacter sp. GS-14]TPV56476.1 AraC family transcriptional regulator [Aestuariibacter sp. GS-14]